MRLHLFEFEDLRGFPDPLRTYMTDYLAFMAELGAAAYGRIGARIALGARRLGVTRIVELGAGGAGPSVPLARAIWAETPGLPYVLTDLYPNLTAWELRKRDEPGLVWSSEPIDATAAPARSDEYRVLCNCFHHFDPESARRVLRSAWEARAPIAVVEVVERSFLGLSSVLLGALLLLVATPFVRPFSVGRLLLTYAFPIIPAALLWDGLVSVLRIYSPRELGDLVADMETDDYRWEIGKMKFIRGPGRVGYLLGEPTAPRCVPSGG